MFAMSMSCMMGNGMQNPVFTPSLATLPEPSPNGYLCLVPHTDLGPDQIRVSYRPSPQNRNRLSDY
jgi:hypothetical protein